MDPVCSHSNPPVRHVPEGVLQGGGVDACMLEHVGRRRLHRRAHPAGRHPHVHLISLAFFRRLLCGDFPEDQLECGDIPVGVTTLALHQVLVVSVVRPEK